MVATNLPIDLDGFTGCGVSSTAHGKEDERVGAAAVDKEAVAFDIASAGERAGPGQAFLYFSSRPNRGIGFGMGMFVFFIGIDCTKWSPNEDMYVGICCPWD